MTQPRVFESIEQTAQRYGVSDRTVRRWIAAGRICGYRVGTTLIRLDPAEVDAALSRPIPSASA